MADNDFGNDCGKVPFPVRSSGVFLADFLGPKEIGLGFLQTRIVFH
jgi:hypothetical protein